ncbi:alpha-1,4-glucan--maltose-1-phosphate maltosyltransferase [Noviherbaspirillum aridicola]|uniref:Alpha-1,4-glucan:maltose-1-phosphate maltosyltransferase n=1 Tax=Noviherbaspirillum aridicola TaxID=2849687 RepID=A0ABQ4Q890_9BURK|nr:alpha-1,4-glucan--maltose-1-phosphate maltosyltransferase [Noviherbaspirillum aridicola]GIZ53274.1 alpha-1,4-glucan:maltose-1-phosphate maltosyltransferase [Noviherbaspirillum aridicola]
MDKATPYLPRICSLDPTLIPSALDAALRRCAEMGFDHVLLVGGDDEAIARAGSACRTHGLQLLVDFDPGAAGNDRALVARQAEWFEHPGMHDDLPDPRRRPLQHVRRRLRYERPEVLDAVLAHWSQRLQSWIANGVAGFRCLRIAEAPAMFWRRLIEQHRDARFLAWTPGCTPEQIQALAGCGFDASFSSSAWWDYRSRWLADEHERLAALAPPIAFPDSPDEPVVERIAGNENTDARCRIYRRALMLAAATGNGILVPFGFEQGLPRGRPDEGASPAFDLGREVAQANALVADNARFHCGALRILNGADSGVGILLRQSREGDALLLVANADIARSCGVNEPELLRRADGYIRTRRLWPGQDGAALHDVALEPADLQLFIAQRQPPVLLPPGRGKQAVTAAARCPRIAIETITPAVDGGQFPAKRTVGETVQVEADVFTDGHDKLAVALLWRAADEAEWKEVRMHPLGNDRWGAIMPLNRIGRHLFAVEAWRDVFATYRDELEKKTTAGLNVSLELEEGRLMVEAAAAHAQEQDMAVAETLRTLAKTLKASREKSKAAARDAERVAALLSEPTAEAMRLADARPFAVRSEALRIDVERTAARFSSWYELFPRSQSGDPRRHGTFADVIARLPAIREMGFDTLYFPPIHPIGRKHRKGRNNSLEAGPDDPGSPYAIGSDEGGHDAIHPELGTIEDFRRLRDEAARHGLELALDFAIQCSPDHPWLKQHPEWFAWRPDGSIRYAENPPKKYQDIVNVDFYAEGAIPSLWMALRDAVLFWVKEGVRVFRVDNPHTKPLPFWEWMIGDIRARYPDTIFLSEAFTRPRMMYRLAKIGYSQSYTYFTWRHTKEEFTDYMTELTTTEVREYFRPHFFVNTPDINPYFLQRSGRPGFLIRAALATTLSGLWGMYSGFELCEGTPVPGKEEYLDSEKYEIRAWDWQRPGNIIAEISRLNRIRKENPALQTHLGIRFLNASDGNILFFMKSTGPADSCQRFGDNVVLVAINLDPFTAHETDLEVPLWEFGLPDDGELEVEDLIGGAHLHWHGKHQHLRLDPFACPYAIWRVRHKGA